MLRKKNEKKNIDPDTLTFNALPSIIRVMVARTRGNVRRMEEKKPKEEEGKGGRLKGGNEGGEGRE